MSDMTVLNTSFMEFFNSSIMSTIRQDLAAGKSVGMCRDCLYQDAHGKVSGRAKQLFRANINIDDFDKTFEVSPMTPAFEFSGDNNGIANTYPYDLQIDLSDLCNSGCIMCDTKSSSKLHADYHSLNQINEKLFKYLPRVQPWVDNDEVVMSVINDIASLPHIEYIHLLGGETLMLPSFYKICDRLVEIVKASTIIMGTTTNCTIWDDRFETLIPNFKSVHLGLSIESTNPLNNYVRYPSDINLVLNNIHKFIDLRSKYDTLFLSLRITPNLFTIFYFDEIVEFMIENAITAESCNILSNPSCLRIELLDETLRMLAINKLKAVANKYGFTYSGEVDIRNPNQIRLVIADVVTSYITFLETYTVPENVESERYKLVSFLMAFEQLRGNSILQYAPEFTAFLEKYGYAPPDNLGKSD